MRLFPFELIDESAVSLFRQDAENAEATAALSDAQLAIIHQRNWFKIFVPVQLGGPGLNLPQAVRLEEEIARADGSVGWTVTLCGGASLFVGFLSTEVRDEILAKERVCIAGSGLDSGIARVVSNGYYISGNWPYATGAAYADYFTANCVVEGTNEVKSFVFKKSEVQLHNTWKVFGLSASACHGFSVKNLRVSFARSFIIGESGATLPEAIFRYPFVQLAQATLAVNVFGMASYFLELSHDIISAKKNSTGISLLEDAVEAMRSARARFYEALDKSWQNHLENILTMADLEVVSRSSKELAAVARKLVNELFPYCGLSAAFLDNTTGRVWRNINTAGQHGMLVNGER